MPITSYIPKKSLFPFKKDESPPLYKKSTDILIVASVVIFVLVLLATGGLYFYTKVLRSTIAELTDSLKRAQAQFEVPTLAELKRTGETIEAAKKILAGHQAPSRIFEYLEKNAHPQVGFNAITVSANTIALEGLASGYVALAEQSLIFKEAPETASMDISGVSLDLQGGVAFSAKISMKPEFINYHPR